MTEQLSTKQDSVGEEICELSDEWEDLLGTGTLMKKVLRSGSAVGDVDYDDENNAINYEAPRKFFALIDIQTKCQGKFIECESHKNYLINSDADLFPGAHLVIPLMNVNETAQYIIDPKFAYGDAGNLPAVPPKAKLECTITLKLRCDYDTFLEQLNTAERLQLAARKRDRGKFWYSKSNYQHAITVYQSLADLCKIEEAPEASEQAEQGLQRGAPKFAT